jgi:hypothetical protein
MPRARVREQRPRTRTRAPRLEARGREVLLERVPATGLPCPQGGGAVVSRARARAGADRPYPGPYLDPGNPAFCRELRYQVRP